MWEQLKNKLLFWIIKFEKGLVLDLTPHPFQQIKSELKDLPKEVYSALNKDAKYLFDIVKIISSGEIHENFLKRKPGKVVIGSSSSW